MTNLSKRIGGLEMAKTDLAGSLSTNIGIPAVVENMILN
jgi:hypothetical protein